MDATDPAETDPTAARPCVVVDRATVSYRVPTTSKRADEGHQGSGLYDRLRRRTTKVTVSALNEISLVVNHGESVGVIGRNGSGKSTLVKLISGQARPSSGAIYASSTPAMLGVNAALVPSLSGDQNITLGCLAMGMTPQQVDEKFEQIVELTGLGDTINLPMATYSSGMASRLQFAIATSIDPEILLIDEALNTGDAQFVDRTKARMDELRDQAGCVVLVSHSLPTIRSMCSRVLWLDRGDLVMDGDPTEVALQYENFAVRLSAGDTTGADQMKSEAMDALGRVHIRMAGRESRRRAR
ncbi:polysaccharide/polyol phosphate ABC transporter ATP-binding protein [Tersicoccus phoenicis]|uniref:Polysaccharide/polyol phosphate ABC transporter ATP-binding protein n=1 Tax=Tersicoccus phoenicis TaxID=554083 RepID=A0A1R1LAG8_9MICC|nr:ABC transporter ATP-binding protein [Tersicoccus phoenicis]OMH24532.1 polysaccharide/polyol phosphate ABC transporter ATP-binding protein [Tersicoccus phoenicis]